MAPIVVTLLLGFVAAWRHEFGTGEASVLNRMVLLYAVPVTLFVGTVGTPRAELVQDIAFVVAIFVAIVGFHALVLRSPISQRDWLDVHNGSFHSANRVSDSGEGDLP